MKPQQLKPETLENLKELATNHQYNQFVRIAIQDANYHFNNGKKVLVVKGIKAGWAESLDELKTGLKFV